MQFLKYIFSLVHFWTLETMGIYTKLLIALKKLRMIKIQRDDAVAAIFSKYECHIKKGAA